MHGDWVAVCQWPDDPVTVELVAPRRTAIVRAEVSGTSRGQLLAANVDAAAVVAGCIRSRTWAGSNGSWHWPGTAAPTPVVVLTKADLVPDADALAEDVAAASPGARVLVCSTVSGRGLDDVRALLAGDKTMALLGASEAGKSTLINELAGAEVLTVQALRDDGKGRHTSVRHPS